MNRDEKPHISSHEEQMKELEVIFDFALEILDKLEQEQPLPAFGDSVILDVPCSCGCDTIVEIYSEGVFRCLQCGTLRE